MSRTSGLFSLRFAAFVAAFGLAVPVALAQAASADAAAARVALPQVQHTMAAGGSDAGALSSSQPVPSIVVTLKRTDAQTADLESFLTGLTTKGADSYHKWLTPAQFAARFAPTADAVAPVRAWLQTQGFTVQTVSAGGTRLVASGTASQVQTTFAVSLHRYAMPSGDSVLVTGTPTVPSAMAASIRAVSGLDSTSASSTEPVSILADAVDANANAVVVTDLSTASASSADLTSVLEQASAQGQSVLVLHPSAALMPARALAIELASDIPAASASPAAATAATAAATSSAAASSDPTAAVNTTPRPSWQTAPGLSTDGLRDVPDAAVGADTSALVAGIQSVVAKAGARQGEVAAIFYQLAPVKGIFTHADTTVPAGTWTAADGLGTVNVDALLKAWPYGTTAPNSSGIVLSAHTVTHGSNISLTANITGSNGTPTGTVQFASTQAGALGTPQTLDQNGSTTYTTNALTGGQYGFFGTYSGDNTYASTVTNTDTATINAEAAGVTGTTTGTLTVGGTIPVTVTVKSASGVGQPAGTVMVYPYGTSIGSQTFSGMLAATTTAGTSTAMVSVPATSGGTFTFQTNCTTDASFSCYQPSSFNVTVAKVTPTVTLTQSGTAAAASLSATVAPPAGSNSSTSVPTGYLQFMDGTQVLGGQTLNANGVATYSGPLGSGTTHSVSAVYPGDNNFNTANSNSTTPTKTTPTVALVAAAGSNAASSSLTATITPPAGSTAVATGSVQFLDGATVLGTSNVNTSGVATYSGALSGTATTHSVTAVYGGDTNYNTATSNAVSIGASATKPTVSLVAAAGSTATSSTLTATVAAPAGSTAVPTGSVQFLDGATVLGTQPVNSAGVATYTGALSLAATTHTITAIYGGDTNYTTATSNAVSIGAGSTKPSVTLTASAGSTAASSSLTVTVAAPAGSTAVPTGSVQFLDGATVLGTQTLNSAGVATYTGALATASLRVGPVANATTAHTVTAVYSGDTNYASATSNAVSIGASAVKPTVALAASAGSTAANSTLTATVAPPAGSTAVPTGQVQFLDGATVLGTQTLNSAGVATYTGALSTAAGAHTLTAVYGGDTNYTTATSNAVSIGATLIATTTSLTSSSGYTGPAGTTFSLIGLVTPASTVASGAAPTGTITITDSGAVVGTGTLGAGGTVTIPVSTLAVAPHTLIATYSGDANYATSISPSITITVATATATLAATLSPTGTVPYGYNATINATVTLSAGTSPPAGTVVATVSGGNGTYTATLSGTAGSAAGTATISFPVPPPGTYTITVTCGGGITCAPVSVTLPITTTKGFTTTTITSLTPTNPQAGSPVSFSATVANSGTGTGAYTYSGTVSFYSNGKFLCSAPVSNGVATCSGVFLSTASQLVTAQYSGDTNWTGSVSTTGITVVPTPIPVTITLSANTTNAIVGQNVTLTAALSSGLTSGTLIPSGSITFYDTFNGFVVNLGSAPLLSNGLNTSYAQLSTTGLQSGVHNIMAVYAGDQIFLQATSTTLVINVGDFTVTFIPSQLQLSQGGSGTANVLVTALGSFAGQVALGCTPPPSSLSTCNITPSVLNAGGTALITVTTTKSTASSSSVMRASVLDTSTRIAAAAGVGGLLSLLLLRRRRRIAALFLLLVMAAAMAGGCSVVDSTGNADGGTTTGGGGSSNNGTPLGTVNFTVTAASVTQPVNARHNFLLPVTTQ